MPIPTYGAAPLSITFLMVRGLQLISFIMIIGLTANFVAEIVSTGATAPSQIVGTLTVTAIATLYCVISVPFFWAEAQIGLFVMCGLDSALLLAFVVIAVVLGKPLSFLNCFVIPSGSTSQDADGALAFTQSLIANMNQYGGYLGWAGATKANCFETKTIWGLSIALCILFTCSASLLPALWYKQKRLRSPPKMVV